MQTYRKLIEETVNLIGEDIYNVSQLIEKEIRERLYNMMVYGVNNDTYTLKLPSLFQTSPIARNHLLKRLVGKGYIAKIDTIVPNYDNKDPEKYGVSIQLIIPKLKEPATPEELGYNTDEMYI